MSVEPRLSITTARLMLRPSVSADFERAFQIRGNWKVARNLSRAGFPPDGPFMAAWFAGHQSEWEKGTAYRFAILHDMRMIGLIDLSDVAGGEGELGYWLEEAAWRQGFGLEAAQAIVGFAFEQIGLKAIVAGHAFDNLASGRLLARLGFVGVGERTIFSTPRCEEIVQRRLRLEADQWRLEQASA
ncbi:MAG: GNAT family N-acetyltransferase [Devosia sp.]